MLVTCEIFHVCEACYCWEMGKQGSVGGKQGKVGGKQDKVGENRARWGKDTRRLLFSC